MNNRIIIANCLIKKVNESISLQGYCSDSINENTNKIIKQLAQELIAPKLCPELINMHIEHQVALLEIGIAKEGIYFISPYLPFLLENAEVKEVIDNILELIKRDMDESSNTSIKQSLN